MRLQFRIVYTQQYLTFLHSRSFTKRQRSYNTRHLTADLNVFIRLNRTRQRDDVGKGTRPNPNSIDLHRSTPLRLVARRTFDLGAACEPITDNGHSDYRYSDI